MVVNSIHQVCHMKMADHYAVMVRCKLKRNYRFTGSRVRLKPNGTQWRTGGEVKGKLANGVGSQYSHTTSEHGVSSITNADAHTSAASSRLNWRPCRFKWTRPFRRKTKSGFCACAITFQTQSTCNMSHPVKCTNLYGDVFYGLSLPQNHSIIEGHDLSLYLWMQELLITSAQGSIYSRHQYKRPCNMSKDNLKRHVWSTVFDTLNTLFALPGFLNVLMDL